MALRIGKKKDNADDWSEESLRQELAQISEQDAEPGSRVASTPTASDDPLADLLADMPDANASTAPVAPPTPAVAGVPTYDDSASTALDSDAAPVRKRPSISPVLLAAGLVFLVVAAGVGAYLMFFSAPAEDETPVVVAQRPPRPATPGRPNSPLPATSVIKTRPGAVVVKATPVPKSKVVPPRTPVKRVTPGKAGIAPKTGTAPAIAPKAPGQAPSVVPVRGVPTPVGPPPGMAGQAGKGSSATTTVQIVRPVTELTPAVSAQLKALWNQGAAAKHRGDNAGARRAWEQILRLRPGHPGIQDAINKLPR